MYISTLHTCIHTRIAPPKCRSPPTPRGKGCSPPGTPHTTPLCACIPLLATRGGGTRQLPPPSCLLKAEPFLVRKPPFPLQAAASPAPGRARLPHPPGQGNQRGGETRSDKQAPMGRPATRGKLAGLSGGGGGCELRFLHLLHFLPPKLETEPRRTAAERDRPPVGAKSAASSPAAKAAEQGRAQPLPRGRAKKPGSRSAEGREKPFLFPAAVADLNSVGKRSAPPAPPFLPPQHAR